MAGPSEGGGMLEVVGAQRRDVLTAGDVAETERDALGNVSEGAGPLDEAGGPAATAKGRPSRPDAPEGGLGDKLSQPAGDRRAAAAMRSRVEAAKLAIAREAVSQFDDSEELEGASGMYDAGRAAKKAAGGLRRRKAKKAAQGSRKAILEGCSRLDEFEIDPATFLAQVGDKINRVKNDLIAQGIKYVRLPEDEWYTMRDLELDDYTAYLGQNAWKPDMTSKSLYNYVVYDSAGVERSFAEALDKQEEVLVFAKLPSAFKIDTPLGSYNPDWAYVEEADGERRVYFVTETKGGKNGEPALRDAEKIKIGCAKKHFEALDLGNDFHYNVRTTYQYEAVKA